MNKGLEVSGVSELIDILEKAGPRHSRNLMRATIHGIATEITKDAKKNAPRGKSKTLYKAIKTRRRRSPPLAPVSEVWVEHGGDARHDAFYWRFVEYGTSGKTAQAAQPFIKPASEKARANFSENLKTQFAKKLEQALQREARRNAKK